MKTNSIKINSPLEADFSLRFSKPKIKAQTSQHATKSWDLGHTQVPLKSREINNCIQRCATSSYQRQFFGRDNEKL
jgi:hypothetical protein